MNNTKQKKKRMAYDLKSIEESLDQFVLSSKLKGFDFQEEAKVFKKEGLGNMAARKRFWKSVEIKRNENTL